LNIAAKAVLTHRLINHIVELGEMVAAIKAGTYFTTTAR